MSRTGRLAAIALLFASFAFTRAARADEQSDVAKARAAYEARNYDEAERRLRAMLDPDTGTLRDAGFRIQARMYWGATLLAKGRAAEASAVFESLLLEDPSFEPDPLSFTSDVVDAFIDTKKRITDKLNAAKAEQARLQAERKARLEEEKRRAVERTLLLERLASEEYVTERHSRWIALVPFGIGQFQNGQTLLGYTFLISESLFLAGAAAAFPFYVYNLNQAGPYIGHSDPQKDPLASYRQRANTALTVNLTLNVAFAVTAVAGIVHAQATFVPPVTETKKRPLPKISELSPIVSPTDGGGYVGLSGRF